MINNLLQTLFRSVSYARFAKPDPARAISLYKGTLSSNF